MTHHNITWGRDKDYEILAVFSTINYLLLAF